MQDAGKGASFGAISTIMHYYDKGMECSPFARYTTNDKFIIPLNSAGGKRLIAVLMLAGAYHNFNMEATCSAFTSRMSWLGYVAKHRQTSQLFESFKTDSWSSFLMTTQLDKPMKVHEYKAIAL